MTEESLQEFIEYCEANIKGDEKSEAQIFLDHFFTALGYKDGLKGAGADLEYRVRDDKKRTTSFADLLWPKRVLIEMKKGGAKLDLHLQQAKSYWIKLAGLRPRYVILCNFDEFWIYDFEKDVAEPADIIKTENLAKRKAALTFLLEKPQKPVFQTNREEVTTKAAYFVAAVFRSMQNRGIEREIAMHYCLQCVLAMFAEDVNLLPDDILTRIIRECGEEEGSGPDKCEKSFDLIGSLFREMNSVGITEGGRYKGTDYFNGGLFQEITPVELTMQEINYLEVASGKDWSKVNPAIFGSFFEAGMDKGERHIYGAHYTYESDIIKIVDPVIVQPWKKAIERAADTDNPLDEYYRLIEQLRNFKVLDPACGSGNFLFVAYRELKMLEKELLILIREHSIKREDAKRLQKFLLSNNYVNTKQFYGMDIKKYAVEVAKVTLMIAKELWVTEHGEDFDNEKALPLDNLDKNILAVDALLDENDKQRKWPEVDAIIGNPPFQSKRNMQKEFGADYVNRIRTAYDKVPGRADFCVYWFYRAHNNLKEGGRAGLVGTNTITENYSREGSLDYIINNRGVIYNAVATQDWSGESAVDVSIVNWKKGDFKGRKYLYHPNDKGELELFEVDNINSSLSLDTDVVGAKILKCNKKPKMAFQGQVPGMDGYLMPVKQGILILKANPSYKEVLKPHLIAEELIGKQGSQPERFIIDFTGKDMTEAGSYKELLRILEEEVLPQRKKAKENQEAENKPILERNPKAKVNKHHITFYNRWWQLAYGREYMLKQMKKIKRYIATSGVSKRNIFEFVSTDIVPNAAVFGFMYDDDYSFGIIQSGVHYEWLKARCSTLEARLRYTTNTVWDSFPWPQKPTEKQIEQVAKGARELLDERNKALKDYKYSLRDLYRVVEKPGKNRIRELHEELDKAVMEAYGFDEKQDLLTQLLELNLEVAAKEENGEDVQAPGLPEWVKDKEKFINEDCVRFEGT